VLYKSDASARAPTNPNASRIHQVLIGFSTIYPQQQRIPRPQKRTFRLFLAESRSKSIPLRIIRLSRLSWDRPKPLGARESGQPT
jgi:hypothetical protein